MSQYIIGKELQRHIDAIKKSDGTAKKAIFEIAYRLAVIADPQADLLEGTGYNNIVELAADQFGYARSTTLNYVKIANRYLTGTNKEVRTICADLDDGGKATADYKVGQLNALPGNVDRDEFKRLDTAGIISKDMSADKIKQTLKDYYNPPSEPEQEPAEPEQEPAEQAEEDKAYTHTLAELVQCLCHDIIGDDYNFDTDCTLDSAMQFLTNREYRLQINCRMENDEKVIETVNVLHCGSDRVVLTYPAIVSEDYN